MISPKKIDVKSKTTGLRISDWALREVPKEDEEDTGWRFQAILINESKSELGDLETDVRYFDASGKFLGVDEGYSLVDELNRGSDKAISVSLSPPLETARMQFTARAKKTSFLEKQGFLLFGLVLLAAAALYAVGQFLD